MPNSHSSEEKNRCGSDLDRSRNQSLSMILISKSLCCCTYVALPLFHVLEQLQRVSEVKLKMSLFFYIYLTLQWSFVKAYTYACLSYDLRSRMNFHFFVSAVDFGCHITTLFLHHQSRARWYVRRFYSAKSRTSSVTQQGLGYGKNNGVDAFLK